MQVTQTVRMMNVCAKAFSSINIWTNKYEREKVVSRIEVDIVK
jgi:hypothetical protein